MKNTIQACIIGFGRAGKFHLNSILQLSHIDICYIVDPNLSPSEELIQRHQLSLKNDLKEILDDKQVEAVVIASPTGVHFEHISQALQAGKHVFAEKPLGKTLDQIHQCYDLAEEKGLALHLGFQRRLDSNFQALRDKIQKIGQIRIIKTSSRDNPQPSIDYLKISGNIFHDMLIHDFDMLSFLLGAPLPEQVFATGHTYDSAIKNIPDFDTVMVNLKYPDGLICSIDTSRISAFGYDQRIEVFGELGMAIAENQRESTVQLHNQSGMHLEPIHYSFPQRYQAAYTKEMAQFTAGILHHKPYNISRKECILAHLIAEAAYESATLNTIVDFKAKYQDLIPE